VEFTVPYINSALMADTHDAVDYQIYIKGLTWSQQDPAANLPINFYVYKACGPDFKLGCFLEKEFLIQSQSETIEMHLQSNPRDDFLKDFPSIVPGGTGYDPGNFTMGEEYTSVRQIIHRYHQYYNVATQTVQLYESNKKRTSGQLVLGIELLGLFYRFWRGSINVRFFSRTANTSGNIYFTTPSGERIQGTFVSNAYQLANLEGSVPYYTNVLFRDNNDLNNGPDQITINMPAAAATTGQRFMSKSAGDDFSFHFLYPPPSNWNNPTYLRDTASPRGSPGLVTYMN